VYALLLWPLAALAHAHLQQALPADGSTVSTAPAQFTLKFSQVSHLTALPTEASAQFNVPAPRLESGVYELRYRVVSADSHVVAGSVHFTIAP
jgi:methionine-rich copper-binding protein CopC